jgi:uncharacterized RDD family membrane protein YckC
MAAELQLDEDERTGSFSLSLFRSIHIDRPGKVAAEFEEFADGVDAVFIEFPRGLTLRSVAIALLKLPLILVGMAARSLLFLPFSWLFVRDVVPMEVAIATAFSEERDIEVHPVDSHPIQLLSDERRGWWAVLALLVWYRPFAVGVTIAALLGPYLAFALLARWNRTVAWLVNLPLRWGTFWLVMTRVSFSPFAVLLPLLLFLIAIPRTIQTRNEVMLTTAEEMAEQEGYDSGCLITGKAHLPGMVATAERRDITVPRTHRSKWLRRGDVTENPEPNEGSNESNSAAMRPQARTSETPILRRIVAAVIDGAFNIALASVALLLLAEMIPEVPAFLLAFVGVPPLFHFCLESFMGRTPGKKLVGITVVSEDGSLPSTRALAIRNLLRPLDFVVFYGLGFFIIVMTDRRQRIGDAMAKTVVVRV